MRLGRPSAVVLGRTVPRRIEAARPGVLGRGAFPIAAAAALAGTAAVIASWAGFGPGSAGLWPVAALGLALGCVWIGPALHGGRSSLPLFLLGLFLFVGGTGPARPLGAVGLLGAQAWNLAALARHRPVHEGGGRCRS